MCFVSCFFFFFFFFNDTATTEIYTLSLHDALPILAEVEITDKRVEVTLPKRAHNPLLLAADFGQDRKSTRLNSSHITISYAVFCLKKKNHTAELLFLRTKRTTTNEH